MCLLVAFKKYSPGWALFAFPSQSRGGVGGLDQITLDEGGNLVNNCSQNLIPHINK